MHTQPVSWGFGDQAVRQRLHTGAERGWQTAGCNGDVTQVKSRTRSEKRLELEAFVGGLRDIKKGIGLPSAWSMGFE